MPKRRQERYQDIVDKLFEEIRSHFDDPARVNRLLVELGRLYDPLLGERIVEPSTHRQIMELLRAGSTEEARRVFEQRVELHNQFERMKQEREETLRSE
jgi:hypothetical protein